MRLFSTLCSNNRPATTYFGSGYHEIQVYTADICAELYASLSTMTIWKNCVVIVPRMGGFLGSVLLLVVLPIDKCSMGEPLPIGAYYDDVNMTGDDETSNNSNVCKKVDSNQGSKNGE